MIRTIDYGPSAIDPPACTSQNFPQGILRVVSTRVKSRSGKAQK